MKITQKGEKRHFINTGIYCLIKNGCKIFFNKQFKKERDVKKMQKKIKNG